MIFGTSRVISQIFSKIGDKNFFPKKWPRAFTSHPYALNCLKMHLFRGGFRTPLKTPKSSGFRTPLGRGVYFSVEIEKIITVGQQSDFFLSYYFL